jgi:hypothetical protein
MKAYSLMKSSKTEETHIFEGDFTTDGCTATAKSICKKIDKNDGKWIENGICLKEQKAREKAATIGRPVCGDCVSHLYTTY